MKNVYEKAEEFVLKNGTDLQKVCCKYLKGSANKSDVAIELQKYQNNDGGWSNGLEIEYTGPISSPFTTVAALGYISRFDLKDTKLMSKTLEYLKSTQLKDGQWDDSEEMLKYSFPLYMGPGVYPEYKTGMMLKWLIRLGINEVEMMDKAKNYLINAFDEISAKNDFWSAVAYSSVFSLLPETPEYKKIMEWSMKILMPKEGSFGWQQAVGMIEDDMPIPSQIFDGVVKMIEEKQEEEGGWPQPFGLYNQVWSAIFILRFLKQNNLNS